jgi:hypothetical protein
MALILIPHMMPKPFWSPTGNGYALAASVLLFAMTH